MIDVPSDAPAIEPTEELFRLYIAFAKKAEVSDADSVTHAQFAEWWNGFDGNMQRSLNERYRKGFDNVVAENEQQVRRLYEELGID